ncbi:hypothetical protein MKW92_024696 [Papaver armeniacum]|nr:hypothetical protein MKW92_024696 [Papaver armeniacum]
MAKKMNGIEVIDIWSDEEDDESSPEITYNSVKSAVKVIDDDDCSILEINPFDYVDKISADEAAKAFREDLTIIVEVEIAKESNLCRHYISHEEITIVVDYMVFGYQKQTHFFFPKRRS